MEMTVGKIVNACGGKLLCGNPDTVVTSVAIDSREVAGGSLFVPLKGKKTDAHTFLHAAFASGAAAALTQEHTRMEAEKVWIAVDSTQMALQHIAAAYRKRFPIPVVGITGSVGKTTTKEMVALALSTGYNVMKTRGNYNSEIGLPLMMFEFSREHEAAVVEMGMSDFGEMACLARVAEPKYAVMTNIGISHIGQLKTRENILREKLHITDRFTQGSVLFLNGDDPMLASLRGKTPYETVFYGTAPWCDFRAEEIMVQKETTTFRCIAPRRESVEVTLPVPGMHHALDALAGLAVAERLGAPLDRAAAALRGYRPLAMRQQICHVNGVTVIDDSYNASPDSAKSSLSVLSGFRAGRRVAVLADMLELGEYSRQAHFEVGVCAAENGVDILFTVGPEAKAVAEGARSIRSGIDCRVFDNNDQAIAELKSFLSPGDAVLVKGSRGMHTDEIVRALPGSL
jgi:UDP-N-acetylmuramoyl-tripeptide--D-alanyl-D-alanine ligase